jgi:hypothetical protein
MRGNGGAFSVRYGTDPQWPANWRHYQVRNDSVGAVILTADELCGRKHLTKVLQLKAAEISSVAWDTCDGQIELVVIKVEPLRE